MLIKNRYESKQMIGDGGMGRVYLAIDTFTQQQVAIKTILLNGKDNEMLVRIKREFQFLSAIDHPNIIKAIDFVPVNNYIHMVIEYIKGFSLQDFIVHQKKLSLNDQLAIALQLARAVEVINATGIIHRDIKPSNIMIDVEKRVIKVLDLGAGKKIDGDAETAKITKEGAVIGSPAYMSPEQIKSKVYDNSDVFSTAATIYQVFLWQVNSPFERKNILATLNSIANEILPPLHEVANIQNEHDYQIYKQLSSLLIKGLSKSPSTRIHIKSFVQELEEIYNNYLMLRMQASGVHGRNWSPGESLSSQKREQLEKIGEKYGADEEVIRQKAELRRTQRQQRQQKQQKQQKFWVTVGVIVAVIAAIALLFKFMSD